MESIIAFVFSGWSFVFLLVLFFLFILYRVFRYGGFRGAMHGAYVVRELGVVRGEKANKFTNMLLRVHELRGHRGKRMVGFQLEGKTFASWQSMFIALNERDAQRMAAYLLGVQYR